MVELNYEIDSREAEKYLGETSRYSIENDSLALREKSELIGGRLVAEKGYDSSRIEESVRSCAARLAEDKGLMQRFGVDEDDCGRVCIDAALKVFVNRWAFLAS